MSLSELSIINILLPTLVTAVVVLGLNRPAKKFGLSTIAGGRRVEKHPVPLVGGVAIVFATYISLFLMPNQQDLMILLFLSIPIFALGAFDDAFELNAPMKLPLEILCSLVWVCHFDSSGLLLAELGVPVFTAQALTAFWIVGVTNAMNLSDGIDGLVGSLAVVICAGLIFASPTSIFVPLWAAIAFAVLGFLPFNFAAKFKTFLGDSGSLWLGFVLACTASTSRFSTSPELDLFIILSLFSYSEFDTLYSVVRRLRSSVPIMTGDYLHIHHQLRQLGFRASTSSLIIVATNSIVGLSFILGVAYSYVIPAAVCAAALCLFAVVVRSAGLSRASLCRTGGALIASSLENPKPNIFVEQKPQSVLVATLSLDKMFGTIPLLSGPKIQEVAWSFKQMSFQFEMVCDHENLLFFSAVTDAPLASSKIAAALAAGLKMGPKEDGSLEQFVMFAGAPETTHQPTKAA